MLRIPLSVGVYHDLFVKAHRENSVESDHTSVLFVGNIDLVPKMSYEDIEAYLKSLFGSFGSIEGVHISAGRSKSDDNDHNDNTLDISSQNGVERCENITSAMSRFAHVSFSKSKSVRAILSAIKNKEMGSFTESIGKDYGYFHDSTPKRKRDIAKMFPWLDYHSLKDVREDVNEYMRVYEEEEEIERKEKIRRMNEMDADGFIPVRTRNKKKKETGGTHGGVGRSTGTSRARGAKKKDKELKNFYRFQLRQEKEETLVNLRAQFEKDKMRVAELRSKRQFKPF